MVLQWKIAAAGAPAQSLNGHAQIGVKTDRICDVPSIQAKSLLRFVETIRLDHLNQAAVRRSELLILLFFLILEVIRSAEIIFRPGSVNRREGLVAVHVELDFSLAPPAVVVNTVGEIGSHVLPLPFYIVEDGVDIFIRERIYPSELRMEVRGVLGNLRLCVVDLIVDHHGLAIQVLNR